MVGLDGTGKTTAVQLAAFIANCDLFRLTLTRGYNMENFREDLKKVCVSAGVADKKIVFLLTDTDIVKVTRLLRKLSPAIRTPLFPDMPLNRTY